MLEGAGLLELEKPVTDGEVNTQFFFFFFSVCVEMGVGDLRLHGDLCLSLSLAMFPLEDNIGIPAMYTL